MSDSFITPTFSPQPRLTQKVTTPAPPVINTFTPCPSAYPSDPTVEYKIQSGDYLPAVANRFGVMQEEIETQQTISHQGLLPYGQLLFIPDRLFNTTSDQKIIPDTEFIFSPTAKDFDVISFVEKEGGYLNNYWEPRGGGWINGAQIVERAALDYSINPRLILSLLEHQSSWVTQKPAGSKQNTKPLGWQDPKYAGLTMQLDHTLQELSTAYYGWRNGSLTELPLRNGKTKRIDPSLNPASVALQYLFMQLYGEEVYEAYLYGNRGLLSTYSELFGNPWQKDYPQLLPDDLSQPILQLPFLPGQSWNFTSGPHAVWRHIDVKGALDFAPRGVKDCGESQEWITASAPGIISRIENGLVVLDLDGDGNEFTGWVIFYVHIIHTDHLQVGSTIKTGDKLGYPSCEGGRATGTHLHICRKYNGEWMLADGAVPFNLSGWEARAGNALYDGSLVNGDRTIVNSLYGERWSVISLPIEQ